MDSVMRDGSPDHSFLPLARAAHCLRCQACFAVGAPTCPDCGSKAWAPFTPVMTRARRRSASVYVEDPIRLAA